MSGGIEPDLRRMVPGITQNRVGNSPGTEFLRNVREAYQAAKGDLTREPDAVRATSISWSVAEGVTRSKSNASLWEAAIDLGLLEDEFLNGPYFEWPEEEFADQDQLVRFLCTEVAQHLIVALLEEDDL